MPIGNCINSEYYCLSIQCLKLIIHPHLNPQSFPEKINQISEKSLFLENTKTNQWPVPFSKKRQRQLRQQSLFMENFIYITVYAIYRINYSYSYICYSFNVKKFQNGLLIKMYKTKNIQINKLCTFYFVQKIVFMFFLFRTLSNLFCDVILTIRLLRGICFLVAPSHRRRGFYNFTIIQNN